MAPFSNKALRNIDRVLNEFRKLDTDMQASQVQAFLFIATHPDCTVREVADGTGVAVSSASRNVAALSKWHRLRRPGYELVEMFEDLMDRRLKRLRLTPKGTKLAGQISKFMEA